MRTKYTAKWGVQIVGMIFQIRSRTRSKPYQNIKGHKKSFHNNNKRTSVRNKKTSARKFFMSKNKLRAD
ncbi:DUF6783 domain-containing protein [Blautia sp.]|uniref:DUF6783 domain-containing protein n=1 Tax=Blautia sp. TaxID=1955243 RepID=UPI003FA462D1